MRSVMPLHKDRHVSFETPADWEERTMVAFRAPPGEKRDAAPAGPVIAVTREPMRDTDTLSAHAERRLVALGRELSEFQLLDSRETEVGGRPALQVRYAWEMASVAFEETVAFVDGAETPLAVVVF